MPGEVPSLFTSRPDLSDLLHPLYVLLARSASDITIGSVVRALEGPLAPIACASPNFYRRCEDCPDEDRCAVHMLTVDVRNAIAVVLDQTTLADMLVRLSDPGSALLEAVRSKAAEPIQTTI